MKTKRFIPKKRIALDGKIWWCVFDTLRSGFSTFTCHGKYKTKNLCEFYIDFYDREWNLA